MNHRIHAAENAGANYEYRGLLAETWDLFRGDTSTWPDRFFYREVIARAGQPVLDVGCGTGRLLLDYLTDGIEIEGVDSSPEMLALSRAKAAERHVQPVLYQQPMEDLQLPRAYRTILVPSSSFQLITDPAAAGEALRRLYAHLAPGGVLVMSFMSVIPATGAQEWHLTGDAARDDGTRVRRWSRAAYDPEQRLEHTETRYEVLRGGEVVHEEHHVRSPATREYSQEQVRQLYEDAGFTRILLTSGFAWNPATETDTLFCALGTHP